MKRVNPAAHKACCQGLLVADRAEQQRLKLLSPRKWFKGDLMISTDKRLLDYAFLQQALAAASDERRLTLALHGSLCFGLYRKTRQIGFARLVTDLCDTAVLRDLYIAPEYRFIGLGSWLLACCLAHPAAHHCGSVICSNVQAQAFLHKRGFVSADALPGLYRLTFSPQPPENGAETALYNNVTGEKP